MDAWKEEDLKPDDEEIDRLINFYRDELMIKFPFVVIPPNITRIELEAKPTLLKCIIMVSFNVDTAG